MLVTVVNTDPRAYWLTSFLETSLLRAVWYPTTVATNSREIKKVIKQYLEETGDVAGLSFKLHDFGARGVSSLESAGIGGCAHLVNFMGTDTVEALLFARRYYGADMAGFSIPAMEHSTVTSWGREHEVDSYRNMVKKNLKPGGLAAAVSDSYDIYEACKLWGTELKQDVIDSGGILVVRPDSGEPWEVVLKCIQILEEHFGAKLNDKGYLVLNNVRVIQGDGINILSIKQILEALKNNGYSADNVAFGQGGALLQIVNRDDQRFAMKCSAICVNGEWREVFKDPVTDSGKRSKKGRLYLYKSPNAGWITSNIVSEGLDDQLQLVYKDGMIRRMQSLDEIRELAAL